MSGDYDDRRPRRDYQPRYGDEGDRPYQPRVAPGKLSRSAAVYGLIHRASDSAAPVEADPGRIEAAARTSGQALPAELRAELEQSVGADLSGVRVHTGSESGSAAQSIQAKAYTTGSDIHFAPGSYDPGSDDGRRLIAHEVAHTVQQAGAPAVQAKLEVSQPGDAAEVEADRFADAFVAGSEAPRIAHAAPAVLARKERPGAGPADESDERAPSTLDGERDLSLAGQLLDKLTSTFAPKHLAARDGLRADRSRSNGHKAAASILRIRAHVEAAKAASIASEGSSEPSMPGQPNKADQFSRRIASVEQRVAVFANEVAPLMGLQAFRGALVPGNRSVGGGDLAREIDAASELAYRPIMAVEEIREIAGQGSGDANAAAALIKRHGLDDAQRRFLFRILEAEGLYEGIEQGGTLEQGSSGRPRSKTVATVRAQANDAAGGVPTSVDGVFLRLEEAKAAFVAGDTGTALAQIGLAQAALRNFAKNYDKVVGGFGGLAKMKLDSARGAALYLEKLSAYARIKRDKPGVGALYDVAIGELAILREPLELLAGEIQPGQATLLHALDTGATVGPAILAAVPATLVGGALAAKAVPIIATVVARSGGPLMSAARSLKVYAATNPILAQEISVFATGIGIEVLDLGVEGFLDQLSTPEGLLMLVLELLIMRNAVESSNGGRGRSRGGADGSDVVERGARPEAPAAGGPTPARPRSEEDEIARKTQAIIDELQALAESAARHPQRAAGAGHPQSHEQRTKRNVGQLDQPLENPRPGASPKGHGHADHGSQTTGQEHAHRVETGTTPSGRVARRPPPRSSGFRSDEMQLEAEARARRELEAANPPKMEDATTPARYPVVVETTNDLGFGDRSYVPKRDASGRMVKRPDGTRIAEEQRGPITSARVVFEYVPSTDRWEVLTMFPDPT